MADFTAYVVQCKGDGPPEIVFSAGTVTECEPEARAAEVALGQGAGWVKVVDDRKGKVLDLNGNGIHLAQHIVEKKAAAAEAKKELVKAAKAADAAIRKAKVDKAKDAVKAAEAALAQVEADVAIPEPKKKAAKKKTAEKV